MSGFQIRSVSSLAQLEPLLDRYVRMVVERMAADNGVDFGDPEQAVLHHNRLFREESVRFLVPPGRLLAAYAGGEPVGVAGIKRAGPRTGEIKRLYVAPSARGLGIGRALLDRLLDVARFERFDVVRLETASFMTAALRLYRSAGFRDAPQFADSETATSGMKGIVFLQLTLNRE
ncbi:MAG: GNAT family N-acetyltransferase [Mycolicibacterium mageritense]|nr:hypothetical protein EB73_01805 [Mycobacterium sp. SWH-M3]TXI65134.1 MAG: GNAT family N-acetyltransferase [Mycolicibacterium mageritense]